MSNPEAFDDGLTRVAEKEFNLSDLEIYRNGHVYRRLDVKEFIRLLKENLKNTNNTAFFLKIIDKLAGEKLK